MLTSHGNSHGEISRRRALRYHSVLAALLLGVGAGAVSPGRAGSGDSPPLAEETRARIERGIGRLLVPAVRYRNGYPRHYDEQCSATLVSDAPRRDSRLLISAWHCVEDYRDLSRDLIFVSADARRHRAGIVASGGSMDNDWVLLRLREPLPGPLPLAGPDSGKAGALVLAGLPKSAVRDSSLVLRTACAVTGYDGTDLRSDCVLTRGASGGAAVDVTGTPRYLGVISRGDGASQSIFVPVARFYEQLRLHLATAADPAAP